MERKVIAVNRQARHNYHVRETIEAGIALQGTEVKSLRMGKVNLKDSFARAEGGEVFLYNMHVSPYDKGNRYNHDPLRPRKLLLHKAEITRLQSKIAERGLTLIPLELYFNEKGIAKVALAVAQGKKLYDKRQDLAKRDLKRRLARGEREF
ncbi:MAG: SsrA-binding protein SmpB [Firmicutes bacterium]|nr:SsrA-binding protein SmpB [Bacillota bacterium]HOB22652.1 SsrA-binding protein SmpB [Bacillota bacterium]